MSRDRFLQILRHLHYNYYTGVALFEELEQRKTLACGTVRPTRRNLWSERKESKTAQKGREFVQAERKCNMCDMAWLKTSELLATTPTSKTDQSVLFQCSVKVNGNWEKRDFARPGVINLNNTHMGRCWFGRPGVVWYFKVFFYMIEVPVCISNGHICTVNLWSCQHFLPWVQEVSTL